MSSGVPLGAEGSGQLLPLTPLNPALLIAFGKARQCLRKKKTALVVWQNLKSLAERQ